MGIYLLYNIDMPIGYGPHCGKLTKLTIKLRI